MIEGGWEFVMSAYGITWGVLALYALSLWFRFRGLIRGLEKRGGEGV